MILPLSLARDIGSLRYMSALGLVGSLLLMVVVTIQFFTNSALVPDRLYNLSQAQLFIITPASTVEVIPFIIFLYMYQALLPQSYKELERRSLSRMDKVVGRASVAMIGVYLPIGVFGYLTFAD